MNNHRKQARCLCGAVTIEISKAITAVEACHCSMCRRWGGGPYFSVDCGSHIQIEGEAYIENYQSSDWAERGFCRQCGTHLYYHLKGANQYMLTPGLFDDPGDLKFDMQVFIDEKPPYYSFTEDNRKLTGEEVFKLFADQ